MPAKTKEASRAQRSSRRKSRSPVGSPHRSEMRRRARRSAVYRAEQQRLAPYERIARLVISRRHSLNLSQKELAERMGTSHSVISRIESGQHPTSVETLRRLANAFETNLVVGFADARPDEADPSELVAVS
ncbi:MAG: helix-turn-helix domain-containing protein [Solirubrobacterales bacterium]